ncbi:hypothetical protein ACX12E_02150 [Paenibacillus vandeheii]
MLAALKIAGHPLGDPGYLSAQWCDLWAAGSVSCDAMHGARYDARYGVLSPDANESRTPYIGEKRGMPKLTNWRHANSQKSSKKAAKVAPNEEIKCLRFVTTLEWWNWTK